MLAIGVYSRVSSQYDWINEMVCEHSTAPPESFGCAGGGNNNTSTESDETDDTTVVTVEVWLDDKPKEFSWIMSTLNGGGFSSNQVVASIPSGYYHDWSNFTFQHKVQVKPNQFYRMSLRDKFGDGLRGYVAVYRGSVATTGNLIMYEPSFYNSDTGGKLRSDYGFFSGKEADSFLSLTINFDKVSMNLLIIYATILSTFSIYFSSLFSSVSNGKCELLIKLDFHINLACLILPCVPTSGYMVET
jgi:hypothetical protein